MPKLKTIYSKLTQTVGSQKNKICSHVAYMQTGRPLFRQCEIT